MARLEILVTKDAIIVQPGDTRVDTDGYLDFAGILVRLLSRLETGDFTQVRVSSDQLGVLALDSEGIPIASTLWADDERSADDAAWCNKKHPAQWWLDRVGDVPRTHHGITKLSLLHRSDPDAWKRIRRICGVDDYLRWLLLAAPVEDLVITTKTSTDMGWGSLSGPDLDVLALIDKDMSWEDVVPPVLPLGIVVGTSNGVEIVT